MGCCASSLDDQLSDAIIDEDLLKIKELVERDATLMRTLHLLHLAAELGKPEAIKALLDLGADVGATFLGQKPIHNAAINNRAECVEVLAQGGANVEATNEDGLTALQIALHLVPPEVSQKSYIYKNLEADSAAAALFKAGAGADISPEELFELYPPIKHPKAYIVFEAKNVEDLPAFAKHLQETAPQRAAAAKANTERQKKKAELKAKKDKECLHCGSTQLLTLFSGRGKYCPRCDCNMVCC